MSSNPAAWDAAFLDCDYLGAKWFWHNDGMRVGNGGFSLRSRRLLLALQDPRIDLVEAEDTAICRMFPPAARARARAYALAARRWRTSSRSRPRIRSESPSASTACSISGRSCRPPNSPACRPGSRKASRARTTCTPPRQLHDGGTVGAGHRDRASDTGGRSGARCGPRAACAGGRQCSARPRRRPQRPLPLRKRQALQAVPRRGRRGRGRRRHVLVHGTSSTFADALIRARHAGAPARRHRSRRARLPQPPFRRRRNIRPRLHYLGVIHYQRNRIAEALPLLERAVALVPEEPEFHNNLGLALAAADRLTMPSRTFDRRLRESPTLPPRGTTWAWRNRPRTDCRKRPPRFAKHSR